MNKEFAIAEVMPGKLNALVKNIMRQTGEANPDEAVRLVNSGEWIVSKSTRFWREVDGIIYFSVESDGTTGPEWIEILGEDNLSEYAKDVLRSKDFQPTTGVVYEIAVLKGRLFNEKDRITSKVRTAAEGRGWSKPHAEVACLTLKNFSNEEIEAMGLAWIVTMHESIKDFDGGLGLLGAGRSDGGRWLHAYDGGSDGRWHCDGGFAFAVSSA